MITSLRTLSKAPQPVMYMYDCETDGIDASTTNITEVCLRIDGLLDDAANYFVGYMSKPDEAVSSKSFQKPFPADTIRCSANACLTKMAEFINETCGPGKIAILLGYNVKGWDEPVLQNNCRRFEVRTKMPWHRMKFVDLAIIGSHLGFCRGTTQQQLESALRIRGIPANRHRALADVKVVTQIWRRMVKEIGENAERVHKLRNALMQEDPEAEVAKVLLEYDPSLAATPEMIQKILETKAAETLTRKEIMVLIDTETTGLLPKLRSHKDRAIRIVQIGAKILSPYSGADYEETFETLVNPEIPIPASATEVHKITDEHVVGKPSAQEAYQALETWVKTTNTYQRIMQESAETGEQDCCIVFVGYNTQHYDLPILTQAALRGGIDLKREINKSVKKSYDVMMLMSTWYTGQSSKPPSNKLQDHARFLGIPEDDAHRALGDVRTLERVLRSICGPLNPIAVISEAMKFPGSPGRAAKAIIKEAQSLIATVSHEKAIEQAVEVCKIFLEDEASIGKPPRSSKKRKLEPDLPLSTFLVKTQEVNSQFELI